VLGQPQPVSHGRIIVSVVFATWGYQAGADHEFSARNGPEAPKSSKTRSAPAIGNTCAGYRKVRKSEDNASLVTKSLHRQIVAAPVARQQFAKGDKPRTLCRLGDSGARSLDLNNSIGSAQEKPG
jgi:hypothetical protein